MSSGVDNLGTLSSLCYAAAATASTGRREATIERLVFVAQFALSWATVLDQTTPAAQAVRAAYTRIYGPKHVNVTVLSMYADLLGKAAAVGAALDIRPLRTPAVDRLVDVAATAVLWAVELTEQVRQDASSGDGR